jgi:hypothetical protein
MAKEKRASVYFDRETLSFVGIDALVKKQLSDVYPKVDIDKELIKMSLWLQTPKGKKYRATIGFVMSWLSNACPAHNTGQQYTIGDPDSPLVELVNDYLKGLWKDSEHILEFNTKRT